VTGRPVLTIRLKRGKDGPDTLSCYRADGTFTMQYDRTGGFFPIHDLTHYAVETVLGLDQAFFGLVAAGWDFADFGAPWRRGRLGPEALTAEFVVGAFDLERAGGYRMTGAELTALVRSKHGESSPPGFREIDDELLAGIRTKLSELFGRWQATGPGETLELTFPEAAAPPR
jgi:hypothetical protein